MRTTTSLVPLLALAGCAFWSSPPHDHGDDAFVAQAIETVLGRKPHGSAEIRALSTLAGRAGREAVLDVLFAQPEYVAYWSNVLADDLQIQRDDAMQVDGNCLAPALLPPMLSDDLAEHLASAPPDAPFCALVPVPQPPWDVSADELAAVLDAAIAAYPHTRLDKLETPKPSDPIEPGWSQDLGLPGTGPDLEALGRAASNGNRLYDDGLGKVALEADWPRWIELADIATTEVCPTFNLTDVVEASVRADRLDAMLRAYLPVMATFPGTGSDADMRDELGSMFLDVYLDRDPTCMTCHSATYSTTDPRPRNGQWDRFFPIWSGLPVPIDLEGAAFSYEDGSGSFVYLGDGGEAVRESVGGFFRADNHTGGLRPWGIDETCVTNPVRGFDGLAWGLPPDPLAGARSPTAFAGVGPSDDLGVLDLVTAWSDATGTFDALSFEIPDWAGYRATHGAPAMPTDPGCELSCHRVVSPGRAATPGAPLLRHVVPTMTDARLLSVVTRGRGQMPAVARSEAEGWNAVAWVRSRHPSTPALQPGDRAHAFVYLAAANVVHRVVDEVWGEDLAMPNGFPRNPAQARALSVLTERFLESRFSLRAVLEEILASDGFNRAPPADPSTAPYALEMLPYPEAGLPPTAPTRPLGSDANAEGDFVHRHGPAGLLHQVASALGWPAPRIAGRVDAWPTRALMRDIGRETSRRARERPQLDLDTYVTWDTRVATCEKPALVLSDDVSLLDPVDPGTLVDPTEWVDWIDLLIAEAGPRGDTWEQLAVAIKDRLLADPSLDKSEKNLIAALWGISDLHDVPNKGGGISPAEEAKLREYCGVLLSSPQFLLRGIWPAQPLPATLPAPVCLPGEPCGEAALYARYEDAAKSLGWEF